MSHGVCFCQPPYIRSYHVREKKQQTSPTHNGHLSSHQALIVTWTLPQRAIVHGMAHGGYDYPAISGGLASFTVSSSGGTCHTSQPTPSPYKLGDLNESA